MPDSIIRTMPDDEHCTALSPAQYSDYLGLDITRITPTATLSKSTISVRYKDDTIIYDECLAYYTADGEPMMIRFSKTMSMVPSNLVDGQTSQVEDVTILAAVGENGCSRTAAFDWNGISICLYSSRMDQQTFEQFLLDFLNTLKK